MARYTRWVAKYPRLSVLAAAVVGFASASWLDGVRPELDASSSVADVCVADERFDGPEEPRVHIPTDGLPHKGAAAADAKVTMLVCADFECGFCRKAARTVNELLARNDDLAFYHLLLPLRQFEFSMLKALSATAAHRQGAFWPMHDALHDEPIETPAEAIELARRLGLDADRFASDLRDPSLRAEVDRQIGLCKGARVRAVPYFFINGRRLRGARPIEDFQEIIDEERR
jgi:protein-disulfide isomerase